MFDLPTTGLVRTPAPMEMLKSQSPTTTQSGDTALQTSRAVAIRVPHAVPTAINDKATTRTNSGIGDALSQSARVRLLKVRSDLLRKCTPCAPAVIDATPSV